MTLSRTLMPLLLALLLAVPAAACAADAPMPAAGTAARPDAGPAPGQPLLHVHKTPWCGCCNAWIAQAGAAGFAVKVRDHEDLMPIKQALGVPPGQYSCHTAEIDGYFVEGHVPFADIRRLLAERPDARGIAVPGMPLGSPGMEAHTSQSFTTRLVGRDGRISDYAHHPGDDPSR